MKLAFAEARKRGFTLIELLAVIAIVAILAGLVLPSLAQAKQRARYINEINSAKQLMLAHRMYADDNAGFVLPGYRYDLPARDRAGRAIGHPINARYPWRIAPYIANSFEILYANQNRALLRSFDQGDEDHYTYAASVFPSLAANSVFVGGDDLVLPPNDLAFGKFGRFCVLRESDAQRPSELMTFVSARARFDGDLVEGFYRAEPPYLTRRTWSETWDESMAPELFGFAHPRYNQRAVAAQFDGHAEGFGFQELQDMRHWANPADRADWVLQSQ